MQIFGTYLFFKKKKASLIYLKFTITLAPSILPGDHTWGLLKNASAWVPATDILIELLQSASWACGRHKTP